MRLGAAQTDSSFSALKGFLCLVFFRPVLGSMGNAAGTVPTRSRASLRTSFPRTNGFFFRGMDLQDSTSLYLHRFWNQNRCTGGGMGESAPFTLFQRISFRANMGARSTSSRSIARLSLAPQESRVFFSWTSSRGATAVYPPRSGAVRKLAYIGGAAASYWVMGGRPSSSSMVRSMEDVVYRVESTKPRLA